MMLFPIALSWGLFSCSCFQVFCLFANCCNGGSFRRRLIRRRITFFKNISKPISTGKAWVMRTSVTVFAGRMCEFLLRASVSLNWQGSLSFPLYQCLQRKPLGVFLSVAFWIGTFSLAIFFQSNNLETERRTIHNELSFVYISPLFPLKSEFIYPGIQNYYDTTFRGCPELTIRLGKKIFKWKIYSNMFFFSVRNFNIMGSNLKS